MQSKEFFLFSYFYLVHYTDFPECGAKVGFICKKHKKNSSQKFTTAIVNFCELYGKGGRSAMESVFFDVKAFRTFL